MYCNINEVGGFLNTELAHSDREWRGEIIIVETQTRDPSINAYMTKYLGWTKSESLTTGREASMRWDIPAIR